MVTYYVDHRNHGYKPFPHTLPEVNQGKKFFVWFLHNGNWSILPRFCPHTPPEQSWVVPELHTFNGEPQHVNTADSSNSNLTDQIMVDLPRRPGLRVARYMQEIPDVSV